MNRLIISLTALMPTFAFAAEPVSRLVFQDHAFQTLRWADVLADDKGALTISPVSTVDGMPKIDDSQRLVQMKNVESTIVLGVRDTEEGKHGSGWILLNTGVRHSNHGDHSHWSYKRKPAVWDSVLDTQQGNPAHVYTYDQCVYLANDARNGYTQIDPSKWSRTVGGEPIKGKAKFFPGGGKHITLATVNGAVGYGTWIDGDGADKGRVDVTNLKSGSIAYSFHTPTGNLHGAIACEGKVFFAPLDGICWVKADRACTQTPTDVKVHHLSFGMANDKPLRTGGFQTLGRFVICTTGAGDQAKAVLIDAKADAPKPVFVSLSGKAETKPASPLPVLVNGTAPHLIVFHDRDKESNAVETMDVISLDPNGDSDFADAKVVSSITVGKSLIQGHAGHHEACTDANGSYLFFTNPGDESISAYHFKTGAIVATFKVGGKPTAILAHGGRDGDD
jgi:hypothetical protein